MAGREREPQTEFGRMLRELRRQQRPRMGQEVMATRLGVSASMYGRYERGYAIPPPETVEAMALALDADPGVWLATAGHDESPESTIAKLVLDANLVLIVRAEVCAGGSIVPLDKDEDREFDCRLNHCAAADFLLEITGDAAYPAFAPGDLVAIRDATQAAVGQIVLVEREEGQTSLVRYVGQRQGNPTFDRLNTLYPPLDEEDLRIIGVATWMTRGASGMREFGR